MNETIQVMGKGPFLFCLLCAIIAVIIIIGVVSAVIETFVYIRVTSKERAERLDGGRHE